MCAKQIVFKADEIERLRTQIKRLGEDTNQLYMNLRGQSSDWSSIPLGGNVQHAQNLVIRLAAGADKLEDTIRSTLQGVERLQGENKRSANQWGQQLSGLERLFGRFGSIGSVSAGRVPIPSPTRFAVTNLIRQITVMSGRDELNQDGVVQKLQNVIRQPGISMVEKLASQTKISDIFTARDQIAKAQTAYDVYKAFGNKTQMEAMHKLAEEARRKLEAFGVNEIYYQEGNNLTPYFKKPAVQACDYDPSITTSPVPMVKNESYQMLLRMAMEQGDKGKWAKSQLDGIHTTMKQMIAAGVGLGLNVMSNQGKEAWGNVAQLAGLLSRLGSYNLYAKKTTDADKEPEKSKNAFFKSLDSFKEIGAGFIGTLENRADKYLDSPYDFFNWLTLGITGDIPTSIYMGAKERADHMWDSKEKFADWLTLGTVEMAKGAFNPEEAWSADHWMNSLGMATMLFGPMESSLLSKGGLKPKPSEMFGKDIIPKQTMEPPGSNPVFITPEGLKFKFNDIQTDSAPLPKTLVQEHYLNEIDRIRKGLDEGTGNSDHPIRTYRNADLSKLEAKYSADPRLTVEMPYVGKGKNGTNSEGWLRDKDYYWKEIMDKYPESISKANKQKIELGFSPINDKQFREYFPQFNIKELNNDTLIHHHIGGGGQAVAVPSKLHPGSGGIHNAEKEAGIWGSDSQYAELLEKFFNK